jgi:hypothetical protein
LPASRLTLAGPMLKLGTRSERGVRGPADHRPTDDAIDRWMPTTLALD